MKHFSLIYRIALMVGLFACLIVPPALGQNTGPVVPFENSADTRPDLWVVTLNAKRIGDYKSGVNRLSVINALGGQGANIRPQDSVIIMHAGVNRRATSGDFLASFIHQLSKPMTLHQIRVSKNLLDNAEQTTLSYPYLARPFSLYSLRQSGFDFSPYRNICHILINDRDGVPNKSDDMAAIRRLSPNQYEECDRILDIMESCSLSAKGDGMFFPLTGPTSVSTGSRVPAYTIFSRYSTYEDLSSDTQENTDLLEISKFEKGLITITLKDTSVSFLRVNSVVVNGIQVLDASPVSGHTLNINDSRIKHRHHNQDTVEVSGIFIRYYNDKILGRRGRVMELSSTISSKTLSGAEESFAAVKPHVVPVLGIVILIGVLTLIVTLITNYYEKTIVRLIIRDKDYRISRRALKKMNTITPYWIAQVVNDTLVFYIDKGIRVFDIKRNGGENIQNNIYLISRRPADILNGDFRVYKGFRDIKQRNFFADIPHKGRLEYVGKVVYAFSEMISGESIEFRVYDRTFHLDNKKKIVQTDSEPFLDLNKKMLEEYCALHCEGNTSSKNKCLINTLSYNKKLYGVLNIYDMNYENRADAIYLRYVLAVDADRENMVVKDLERTAKWVLHSEGLKAGACRWNNSTLSGNAAHRSIFNIVSPPITCYLFLRSDKRARLVYSPFRHDKLQNIEVEQLKEPFHLLHFALFDEKLYKFVGSNDRKFSGSTDQTFLKLGEAGTNTTLEFCGQDIRFKFAYGDLDSGEPRTCNMVIINNVI